MSRTAGSLPIGSGRGREDHTERRNLLHPVEVSPDALVELGLNGLDVAHSPVLVEAGVGTGLLELVKRPKHLLSPVQANLTPYEGVAKDDEGDKRQSDAEQERAVVDIVVDQVHLCTPSIQS